MVPLPLPLCLRWGKPKKYTKKLLEPPKSAFGLRKFCGRRGLKFSGEMTWSTSVGSLNPLDTYSTVPPYLSKMFLHVSMSQSGALLFISRSVWFIIGRANLLEPSVVWHPLRIQGACLQRKTTTRTTCAPIGGCGVLVDPQIFLTRGLPRRTLPPLRFWGFSLPRSKLLHLKLHSHCVLLVHRQLFAAV